VLPVTLENVKRATLAKNDKRIEEPIEALTTRKHGNATRGRVVKPLCREIIGNSSAMWIPKNGIPALMKNDVRENNFGP